MQAITSKRNVVDFVRMGIIILAGLVAVICFPAASESAEDSETLLFYDSFETGDDTYSNEFFEWGSSRGFQHADFAISNDISRTGEYSMKFTYDAVDSGIDNWMEKRFDILQPMEEVWFRWYQYYPDGTEGLGPQWHHRVDPIPYNNNKFFSLGNKEAHNISSFTLYAIETEPVSNSGNSRATIKWRPDGAASGEYGKIPSDGKGIIQDENLRGKWVEYIIHMKTASGYQQYDGVVEMWVDGHKIYNHHSMNTWPFEGGLEKEPFNIFDHGYLMGWMNTGFDETVHTYIDDFSLLSGPPASLNYDEVTEAIPVNECATFQEHWIFCDDFENHINNLNNLDLDSNIYYSSYQSFGRFKKHSRGIEGSNAMSSYYGFHASDGSGAAYDTFMRLAFGKTPDEALFKPAGDPAVAEREINWRFYVKSTQQPAGNSSTGPLANIYAFGNPTALGYDPFVKIEVGYPDQSGVLESKLYIAQFDEHGQPSGSTLAHTLNGSSPVMLPSADPEWQKIDIYVKLNDPGQSNGIYVLRINDEIENSQSGLNWTGEYTEYGINAIEIRNRVNQLNTPFGDNVNRTFDNFVLSRPIGDEIPEIAKAKLSTDANLLLPGDSFHMTAEVDNVIGSFTVLDVLVHYDPDKVEFETITNDGRVYLHDDAIESLLPNFGISSAIREADGQIRIIMATAGDANAVSGDLSVFKLYGNVKEGIEAGQADIFLTDFEVSMAGDSRLLDVSQAGLTLEIVLADKAGLNTIIQIAEQLYHSSSEGTSPGQYPVSARTALWNAIQAADSIYTDDNATQLEINDAIKTLQTAVETFQQAVIIAAPVDFTRLQSAIAAAQAKLESAEEGNKLGQFSETAIEALSDAIETAILARNNASATQSAVNSATSTLEAAVQTFSAQIISFIEGATTISIRDLSFLSSYYGVKSGDANWSEIEKGDLVSDEEITIDDIAAVARIILNNWSSQ